MVHNNILTYLSKRATSAQPRQEGLGGGQPNKGTQLLRHAATGTVRQTSTKAADITLHARLALLDLVIALNRQRLHVIRM